MKGSDMVFHWPGATCVYNLERNFHVDLQSPKFLSITELFARNNVYPNGYAQHCSTSSTNKIHQQNAGMVMFGIGILLGV